jgi:hypothetical protein
VTKSDGTTDRVDLLVRQTKGVDGHDSLRRKGLVDFEDVDILLGNTGLGEYLRDSDTWSDTHDTRRASDNGRDDKLGEDGQSELLGVRTSCEEDSSGSVGYLRSVSSVGGTVLLESGLDLRQRLGSDTGSDSIILVNDDLLLLFRLGVDKLGLENDGDQHLDGNAYNFAYLDRDDLLLELAELLSGGSLGVTVGGKLVLDLSRDFVLLGNVLRSDTHGNQAIGGFLVGKDLLGERRRHNTGSVAHGHAFDTGTYRSEKYDQPGSAEGMLFTYRFRYQFLQLGSRWRSNNKLWSADESSPLNAKVHTWATAVKPEEHCRLRVLIAALDENQYLKWESMPCYTHVLGIPAYNAAIRAADAPPPAGRTLPTAMSL